MNKSLRPTLGIAARTFRTRRFGEQTGFLRAIVAIARKKGMNAYVFGPGDVDWGRERVHGWVPSSRGWQRVWRPLPDVVYDRAWGMGPASRLRLAEALTLLEARGVPHFNPDFGDKLDVYEALRRVETVARHLPETLPLTPDNLQELAGRYPRVYVKPARGRQGKGISVCRRRERGWSWRRADQGPSRARVLPTAQAVVDACRRGRPGERFLAQQGLDLVKLSGGTVDIRVIVQRDRRGEWGVSAIGVRKGRRGGLVSNLHAGGRALSFFRLARGIRLKRPPSRIRRDIKVLALDTAAAMSRVYPTLGELGIDIGLDVHGKLWILEINRQPGRALFSRARLRGAWRRSRRRVVDFAKYLALNGGELLALPRGGLRREAPAFVDSPAAAHLLEMGAGSYSSPAGPCVLYRSSEGG